MTELNQFGFIHRFERATQPGAPALLLLHGSGGDESSLMPLGRAMAPGAALLSPRGNATDHGSPRFFARPGNPSCDDAEIQMRTAELATFACAAAARYQLPPFILVGFSHGANMALHLLLHSNAKWSGAVLMRGMATENDFPHNNLQGKPAEELANQLRETGAEVTLHWEETGHNLSQGDVLMAFDWVRRFYATQRPTLASQ
jgi:phospholipase/carboxylesterase